MPLYTVRLNIADAAPLDGVTPLDLTDPGVTVQKGTGPNADLKLIEVTLAPGVAFGVLDPGVLAGLQGDIFSMINLTVYSVASPVHAAGSDVKVQSPDIVGASVEAQIVDLAGSAGVFPSLSKLFPIDHKLVFDTLADGAAPGPHLVQFSLCSISPEDCAQVAAAEACCNGNGDAACCTPIIVAGGFIKGADEAGNPLIIDVEVAIPMSLWGCNLAGVTVDIIRNQYGVSVGAIPTINSSSVTPGGAGEPDELLLDLNTSAGDNQDNFWIRLTAPCGCCTIVPIVLNVPE